MSLFELIGTVSQMSDVGHRPLVLFYFDEFNIYFVTAPCPPGRFSLTGHEPCQACPLHHYQDQEAQTSCRECDQDKRTASVGSNSTSDCVTIGM